MSNIVTPLVTRLPPALRPFADRVLSLLQRKVELGGDLEGSPGNPQIRKQVLAGAASLGATVVADRTFATPPRPGRRVDDSQAILAARIFGR